MGLADSLDELRKLVIDGLSNAVLDDGGPDVPRQIQVLTFSFEAILDMLGSFVTRAAENDWELRDEMTWQMDNHEITFHEDELDWSDHETSDAEMADAGAAEK